MTYIYRTVNELALHDAFIDMGRKDQFSYEGRKALFEYLESLAEDTGTPIELDVIALCCDYSEEKLSIIMHDYIGIESLEDLQNHTTVIMVDDTDKENPTVIYQAF